MVQYLLDAILWQVRCALADEIRALPQSERQHIVEKYRDTDPWRPGLRHGDTEDRVRVPFSRGDIVGRRERAWHFVLPVGVKPYHGHSDRCAREDEGVQTMIHKNRFTYATVHEYFRGRKIELDCDE